MSKYIDAEAFFKVINTLPYKDTSYPDASVYNGAISDVADMLTHFPAADVAEVKHGRWIDVVGAGGMLGTFVGWECSVCGYEITDRYGQYNYCPNCGALMMVNEDE
jgi:rubrerythrin